MFIVVSTAVVVAVAASFSRVTNHSSDHRSSSNNSGSWMIVSCLSYASSSFFSSSFFSTFFINIYTRLGAVPFSCVCVYICWYWRTSFTLSLSCFFHSFALMSFLPPPPPLSLLFLLIQPPTQTHTSSWKKINFKNFKSKKKKGKEQRLDRFFK